MHIIRRSTPLVLSLLVLLCGGCEDTPEGGADDVARYTEGLIRYSHATYAPTMAEPTDTVTRLRSPVVDLATAT